ncbi:hypothetical protein R6X40_17460 [Rhizobium sp. PL01]|nr:hypothetical protein [Rhizobium sp. PL01]
MLDNDLPTMNRHRLRIEFAFRTCGLSPFLDPRPARINLISGRRFNGRTTIPPAAARAQEDETILDDGI